MFWPSPFLYAMSFATSVRVPYSATHSGSIVTRMSFDYCVQTTVAVAVALVDPLVPVIVQVAAVPAPVQAAVCATVYVVPLTAVPSKLLGVMMGLIPPVVHAVAAVMGCALDELATKAP
jgi:hypothetical protein